MVSGLKLTNDQLIWTGLRGEQGSAGRMGNEGAKGPIGMLMII